jgi:hypothetical protein
MQSAARNPVSLHLGYHSLRRQYRELSRMLYNACSGSPTKPLVHTLLNLNSFAHHVHTSHSSMPSRLIFPMAISINNHSLFLSTIRPDRVPGTPLVILESVIGGSSSSWPLGIRHLSPSVQIYIHDRAGFGKSEVNPLANNRRPKAYAEKAAEDQD